MSIAGGGQAGLLVTFYTAFQEQFHGLLRMPLDAYVSFLWPSLFGLGATLIVGRFWSLLGRKGTEPVKPLTWREATRDTTGGDQGTMKRENKPAGETGWRG